MINVLFCVTALAAAVAATPCLLARILFPRRNLVETLALAGPLLVALNTVVPVAVHLFGIPIRPMSMATAHWAVFLPVLLVAMLKCRPLMPAPTRSEGPPLLVLAALVVLLFPLTHLTGPDTHKWQDLATAVRVEQTIPWLVHPLSLFGFTPRSYPSAHALVLSTIQMLGRTGVDWGFYILSVLIACMGVTSAWMLARRFAGTPREAGYTALFYALSPVFLRYAYWATGRGLFLALLPMLLVAVLALPKRSAIAGAAGMAVLLALSHKVGVVAVVLVLVSLLLTPFVPRRYCRGLVLAAAMPCIVLGILVSPPLFFPGQAGRFGGFVRFSVTRFCWMVPGMAVGLFATRVWCESPRRRRLLPALLLSLPLAYGPDMYGALIALPFITLAAADGLFFIRNRFASWKRPITLATILATAVMALVTLVHRAAPATPDRVLQAAHFLEKHDPRGPYRIMAVGLTQSRIQAYVSGCPRFSVRRSADSRLAVSKARWPSLLGPPSRVYREWVRRLRSALALSDTTTLWYGAAPRIYHVVIDGRAEVPPQGALLYERDGICIYGEKRN